MNRLTSIGIALLWGLALSACTSPDTVAIADQNSPTQAIAQADPDKVVCKSIVKTGTRIGTRECRSKADWDRMREDGRALTESIQNKSAHTNLGEQ